MKKVVNSEVWRSLRNVQFHAKLKKVSSFVYHQMNFSGVFVLIKKKPRTRKQRKKILSRVLNFMIAFFAYFASHHVIIHSVHHSHYTYSNSILISTFPLCLPLTGMNRYPEKKLSDNNSDGSRKQCASDKNTRTVYFVGNAVAV